VRLKTGETEVTPASKDNHVLGDLPDGTFGAYQDVIVQEIQAVNR
jgi:hypothetical protein